MHTFDATIPSTLHVIRTLPHPDAEPVSLTEPLAVADGGGVVPARSPIREGRDR